MRIKPKYDTKYMYELAEKGIKNHFLSSNESWKVGDLLYFYKRNYLSDKNVYRLEKEFYVTHIQPFEIGFDEKVGRAYIRIGVSNLEEGYITWYWGGSSVENQYIRTFLKREGHKSFFNLCHKTYYGMFASKIIHFREKGDNNFKGKNHWIYGKQHKINKRKSANGRAGTKRKNMAS